MFFGLLVSHTAVSASIGASASTPAAVAADFPARGATPTLVAYPNRRAALGDTSPLVRIAVRAARTHAEDPSGAR